METFNIDPQLVERARKWTEARGFNLKEPKTIADKLSWLKVFDNSPLKTMCADKILIHDYCREKLGKDICIPILKVYDKPEDIDFKELPQDFVLKCNHGSGFNIIVRDKTKEDKNKDVAQLKTWLKKDYGLDYHQELHYHYIDRKCFAETFMGDRINDIPDYKILCFNGEPKMIQVISERFRGHKHANIYTPEWKWMDIGWHAYKADKNKPDQKPKTLDKMLEYARILSKDFTFVRVDFYEIDGELYLGELTFVPDAGGMRCKDRQTELEIGSWLKLPRK